MAAQPDPATPTQTGTTPGEQQTEAPCEHVHVFEAKRSILRLMERRCVIAVRNAAPFGARPSS
jgi:hypothetical protein